MAKKFSTRIIGYISGSLIYLSQKFQVDQLTWDKIRQQFKSVSDSQDFIYNIIAIEVKYNKGNNSDPIEVCPRDSEKLKQIEELWIAPQEGKLRLVSRYGKSVSQCLMECADEFGFWSQIVRVYSFAEDSDCEGVAIKTRSINGNLVSWFDIGGYDDNGDLTIRHKVPEVEPIMLCSTRPDVTPEKLIRFVDTINKCVGARLLSIKDCILPEDWEEIAGVEDAQKDIRYA